MNYAQLNLSDNPFTATPVTGRPIWCGMQKLKADLERRVTISLKTSPSSIVLNWGHYGSGKTHAAKYFTSETTLRAIAESAGIAGSPLAFYVGFPRVDRGAAYNLTSSIIGKFGVTDFASKLQESKDLIDAAGVGKFANLLQEYCDDSELQKIFHKLVEGNPEDQDKIGRILFGNSSPSDLRDLQISRKPDSVADLCRLVTTAFNLFTFRTSQIPPLFPAIHLWIDEFEDIASLSAKEQDALAAYLRNLIDWCPRYMTIFLNFTLTPVQGLQDLGLYLGDAVTSRIRQRIEFAEPEKLEVKAYIREMLNAPSLRPHPIVDGDDFAPFDAAAVDLIVENVSPRTPRRVNDVFSSYLDLAAGLENTTQINEAMVRQSADDLGLNL
jgi:AcrR family transcriptional regulator